MDGIVVTDNSGQWHHLLVALVTLGWLPMTLFRIPLIIDGCNLTYLASVLVGPLQTIWLDLMTM